MLPVTPVLLPGPPNEHGDKLEGGEHPVAESMFRESRCWYEVSPRSAILRIAELRLQPTDLLLLEFDVNSREQRLLASDKIGGFLGNAFLTPESKEMSRDRAHGVPPHRRRGAIVPRDWETSGRGC